MFKKLFIMLLVSGLLIWGGIVLAKNIKQSGHLANSPGNNNLFAMSSGEDKSAKSENNNSGGWTNMKFAEFLGKQYGIKLISGSVIEQYQALTNALSQKGISSFLNTKPNDKLTCCSAADALYAMSGATGNAGTCDLKINELIKNGTLKLPASGGNPCDALLNVSDTFTNVENVEKFSSPRGGPTYTNPPDRHAERINPPGLRHQKPASQN